MKAKYLILTALSCMVMAACQGNDPENNGSGNKQSSEIQERLDGLADSVGSIVDYKTLEDSTIIMTDDRGNVITKDKNGNISILTKEGELITIDNSINEDPSAAKDKWYNTKWSGRMPGEATRVHDYWKEFMKQLNQYGFELTTENYSKDSIVTYNIDDCLYNMSLKTSTCAIQKSDTQTKYTYHRTYNYIQYNIVNNEIVSNQGEILYRYTVEEVVTEDTAYYSHRIYSGQTLIGAYDSKDSVLIAIVNYRNNDKQEELLSKRDTTIFYNYRRSDDTQLAVFNNSESYIFKENTYSSNPSLSMRDMNGKEIMVYNLISF